MSGKEELSEVNAIRWDNRWHDSRRFVEECRVWVDRHRAAQQDKLIGLAMVQTNGPAVDKVTVLVESFEAEGDRDRQLILAEDLADLIFELVKSRLLGTRTPPTDALEGFYLMGQSDKTCSSCGQRLAVVVLKPDMLCCHCYLSH